MAHKNALYALYKSLKDIRSNDSLFGGVVLLLAGNGQLPQDQDGHISMAGIDNFVSTPQQLCHTVYPNLNKNHANHEWLCERAILAPTNETVGNINSNLLKQIPGEERSYRSVDSVTETDQ
ncbi:ATP-dependent DNA helicase, partial [Caligus rogercresseyi]